MFIPVGLFLFTFAFYLRTHCASFNINDSGETIMVCDLLTISHSPGYPLHTLWGRVNCLLPLGQPMLRVTFCSLLTGALSVTVLYLILKMLLKAACENDGREGPGVDGEAGHWVWELSALFGALVFAFSYQQWFQSCGAKGGIYTLNTLLSVFMLYLFFKMKENGWFIKSFLLMGFVYGLSLAHHWPNQLVVAPAYFWFFLSSQKRVPVWKIIKDLVTLKFIDFFEDAARVISAFGSLNIVRALTTGLLSLSVYLFLPIRAVQDPLVNWWDPRTVERLWGTVVRKGYENIGDKRSMVTVVRNVKRFWFHAQDQFGAVFTYLLLALALAGLIWLWKRQRDGAIGFLLFGSGVFGGVILFNNPLEGYQWTLDNFFTPVFMVTSVFAAAGVAAVCGWAASRWPGKRTSLLVSALAMGFALMPLILNYPSNDQSRYVSSYDEGLNMLKTVDRNAVILCNGDIDILPLWYHQFVNGKRPEVASFTMQLIPYDWYRDPLMKRWPFLKVPVGQDIRPETVVQDMINQHGGERSFYFTNIFTAPWMREKNPAIPDGFLWRMVNTKGLNFPFTSERLNHLWSTYRLRSMDAPDRGYWDEYTDVMKDSYGIGHDFTGYFSIMNKMPDLALWSFGNALKYRQPQMLARIYMMLGESELAASDPRAAVNYYQETLKRDPRNPYVYAKIGDSFLMMNDLGNAESAYRTSLSVNPQQKEAVDGLQNLEKAARKLQGKPGKRSP